MFLGCDERRMDNSVGGLKAGWIKKAACEPFVLQAAYEHLIIMS